VVEEVEVVLEEGGWVEVLVVAAVALAELKGDLIL